MNIDLLSRLRHCNDCEDFRELTIYDYISPFLSFQQFETEIEKNRGYCDVERWRVTIYKLHIRPKKFDPSSR